MQASIPMADLKAQAAAYVDALAERGSPRIVADHRRDIEVQFVSGEIMGGSGTPRQNSGHPRVTGSGGFKRRLTDAIDKMPQPPFTMSSKARAQKLIALEAELLQ